MTTPDAPPITIRRASEQDSVLLSDIGAETFSDAFGPQNAPQDMKLYMEKSFGPSIQAGELADPFTVFLVAEIEGEPVGYARLREGGLATVIVGYKPIEIVRFYARTHWIGRRVGAALMQASLKEAVARGCDAIWLDVWEKNDRAIAFYKKWGFAQVGTQPFRLGNDIQKDLLMARQVSIPGAA